jgi:DNA polymerase IV (DinB-like DNA polymerase)
MDYFFAQIEERENPQFKGKPVVVGADPAPEQVRCGAGPKGEPIMKMRATGRGVVSTANYIARKYGIHSALPISKAYELCPKAIFLPVNMKLYQKVSENIMEIIKKHSPIFEQVSLDEAYLDLSHVFDDRQKYTTGDLWQKAKEMAKELKEEIFEKEKLTSTVGIGPNKLIAKIAAGKAKPNGLLVIKPNQVKSFLEPLNVEDLPGIGPKTAEKLRALGINKIKELKSLSKSRLRDMFGKVGEYFWKRARGIDEELVSPEEIIKSVGRQITFEKDTRNPRLIFGIFEKMIKEVHQELIENNFSFKTITVICRYRGFETHTKSKTMKIKTNNLEILRKEAKKLLLKFLIENSKLIRLIGVRITID